MKNVLQLSQRVKGLGWLKANRPRFIEIQPTMHKVAKEMSAALGFTVTPSNIDSILKAGGSEAMWRTRKNKSKTFIPKSCDHDQQIISVNREITVLKVLIAEAREENAILARCLMRLADEWDIEFDNVVLKRLEKRSQPVRTVSHTN